MSDEPTPTKPKATELERFAWQVLTGTPQEGEYKYQWAARQIEKRIANETAALREQLARSEAQVKESASADDTKFVELIDTILSCGNPQSSFAYARVARLIALRAESALSAALARCEVAEALVMERESELKNIACLVGAWREACRAIAHDVEQPEDVGGWLVNVNDVTDGMPKEILATGCAQSPMEYLMRLIDVYEENKIKLAKAEVALEQLRDTTSCTQGQYAIIDEVLSKPE